MQKDRQIVLWSFRRLERILGSKNLLRFLCYNRVAYGAFTFAGGWYANILLLYFHPSSLFVFVLVRTRAPPCSLSCPTSSSCCELHSSGRTRSCRSQRRYWARWSGHRIRSDSQGSEAMTPTMGIARRFTKAGAGALRRFDLRPRSRAPPDEVQSGRGTAAVKE
jgi:hypothetical protein